MNKSSLPRRQHARLVLALCTLLAGAPLYAQQTKPTGKSPEARVEMRERVRAEKRAFLIKELSLTASEADQLMPLLSELDDKRFALWRELEPTGKRLRAGDKTLTDEERLAFFEKNLDFHVKEAELERTYYLRARTILSGDRLVRLPWASKEFARRFFGKHRPKQP